VNLTATADNVWIRMAPVGKRETDSGLTVVEFEQHHRGTREATVIASGKGHYRQVKRRSNGNLGDWTETQDVFIPNETKPGDVVLVDALAGQNYDMDFNLPRHNKSSEFQALFEEPGDHRCVREEQIIAIVERD
jgi:co-chaperonin GroES (HSP10)